MIYRDFVLAVNNATPTLINVNYIVKIELVRTQIYATLTTNDVILVGAYKSELEASRAFANLSNKLVDEEEKECDGRFWF